MSKRELEYLSHYTNIPTGILELHSKDVMWATNQGWLNEYQQVSIDETITKFCDSIG